MNKKQKRVIGKGQMIDRSGPSKGQVILLSDGTFVLDNTVGWKPGE